MDRVDDCVEGTYRLMMSDHRDPLNLGTDRMVTINELAQMIIDISGWEPNIDLEEGLRPTYRWIEEQVRSHASDALAAR